MQPNGVQEKLWGLRLRDFLMDARAFAWRPWRHSASITPVAATQQPPGKPAESIPSEDFASRLDQNASLPRSATTIGTFVKDVFVPERVVKKRLSGRTHYRAMLKHVLTPEEVDRVFEIDPDRSKNKLKAIPDWPYLDNVRLADVRPEDVRRLIAAALARGYSTQTVAHIRWVINAIFEHARNKGWFAGENPASLVAAPVIIRKEAHALTLAQAKKVLGAMRYPEKEMTLIAILTNMSMAEICGLQWKHVNLTEASSMTDGKPIPPQTIAVRTQWYLGEFGGVIKEGRNRNLPIPEPLLPILLELNQRAKYTGPDDFVLITRAGTPINPSRIAAQRLKVIGRDLEMPWLSWQVLRRTHRVLAYELGMQFRKRIQIPA